MASFCVKYVLVNSIQEDLIEDELKKRLNR